MITLSHLYLFTGFVFAIFAVLSAADRTNPKRFGNSAFWGLLALSFLGGDHLGDFGNGVLVLCLVALAGAGLLGRGVPRTTTQEERAASAAARGNRLFLPALIIPAVALTGSLLLKHLSINGSPLLDPRQVTLLSLGLGVIIALITTMVWLRPSLPVPFQEGRRLMDSVGWAAVLPQMLTALGAVFALAGVGSVIGSLVGQIVPDGSLFLSVAVYTVGMAVFTMIMGNAFAAFPVLTAAIALPLLIGRYGGDPAIITAIGMLSGFCGTLMTPMAANFNIVPAALLDLRDKNGVIRAQIGTALPLLAANTLLIYFLAFQ